METREVVAPRHVTYCKITGIPEEYNEFLPKDSDEFKRWKAASTSGGGAAVGDDDAGVSALTLNDGVGKGEGESKGPARTGGGAKEAAAPSTSALKKKKKSQQVPEVVLERNTRRGKKIVTTITGLDGFGVKLGEAAKLFGKKFASGASVTKSATLVDQIDVQGDFLDQAVELILKQYKDTVKRSDVYYIEGKKKERYFDDDEDE